MVMSVLLVVMVAVEFHPSCHRCTLVVSLMRMGGSRTAPTVMFGRGMCQAETYVTPRIMFAADPAYFRLFGREQRMASNE